VDELKTYKNIPAGFDFDCSDASPRDLTTNYRFYMMIPAAREWKGQIPIFLSCG
jgi:hypothetical protein